MSDRDPMLDELRDLWSVADPMPDGLTERVLAAVAMDDLDADYELLHLVERSNQLHGVRGSDDAITIEFSNGSFSVLLRVSTIDGGLRRIDGWVAPAKPMKVTVRAEQQTWVAAVGQLGRFEFAQLPGGLVRVLLESDDGVDEDAEQLFATPTFEI